ncbi:lysine transporter LysE [Flavobacterium sp.]|uniref:lysine transporter LysE n=1 Tax=Flavobacterium sp. TaxID=239 RepID=UPI00261E7A49|nr:lysine transporter LysE [Flavobacterium sp.]
MAFVLPLFLGFCIAILAVILPGLINMTAAKISLEEGKTQALSFIFGASVIVFFQTYVAVLFARFINAHLEIISLLQEIGILIFSGLSIYFFWIAKKPRNKHQGLKIRGKSNRFFFGVLLSMLNFLPTPFYVFTSISIAHSGYFHFEPLEIFNFVLGVVLGSFLVFYLYIVAFKSIEKKTQFLMKNMNTIMGTVTALMALFTLFKLCCK